MIAASSRYAVVTLFPTTPQCEVRYKFYKESKPEIFTTFLASYCLFHIV
ncbi:Hypothetical protein CpMEX30_2122 [Corynebacterium pseudotuberculosis]|nr:hypothetical protein CPTC_00766 [Corynebacterium pseudotuberculosis]AKC74802.1 Hypothetical protein Cp226_2117 [Corynebacterium pseudotuberculosis]AKS14372.1 Hypothetical protein CpE19_2038 [Corynebacterium pseudotuberculosis]APQ55098.1 Hypothetical protein CpMEX30_2122 [Corynebacterium pseudotuberculosis]ARS61576.1 Hypothetical protein CpATCC19410_2177 [Corynebacterium pseudotuberculosis]